MKKFYCQESRSIKEFEEYAVAIMHVEVPENYTFQYIRDLDKKMAKFVSELEPTDTPTAFILSENFDKDKKNHSLPMEFFLSMASIFVSHLFTDEKTDAEARLTVPSNLKHIKLSELAKKDLIDKKLFFPNFTIELVNSEEEVIYSVMGE